MRRIGRSIDRGLVLAAMLAAAVPLVPNPRLTPGATVPVAVRAICTPGYAKQARNVPAAEKTEVFRRYGIDRRSGRFEVDHLISLELGGSNAIENLWPQSYTTQPYNATRKDALENRLHWLVCHGRLELGEAQRAIAGDWIAAYRTYLAP